MSENQNENIANDPMMPAVIFAKYLEKRIKAFLDKEAKPAIGLSMKMGQTEPITLKVDDRIHTLGKVTVSGTKYDWKVDKANGGDEELAQWLAKNRPDLVEMKPVMKPGAEKEIMDAVKKFGKPITEDGEVIPGIKWLPGGGGAITITPDKEFERTLRMLNEDGHLKAVTNGLLGIESGE